MIPEAADHTSARIPSNVVELMSGVYSARAELMKSNGEHINTKATIHKTI
jgi:hypothetical protein